MEKTIKRKEVIAYKGMEFNMTCKGFHYEIGKTYKTDKVELCEYGFHACLNPIDVLDYYPKYASSRYFKVKLSSEITKCGIWDTNVAATEITILEEISIKGLLNIAEWWKHENVLNLLYFSDGFARIRNCDKQYNFIGKDGKLLSKQWFEFVDYFKAGFARVKRSTDKLWNFIGKDGKILSDEWFDWVDDFKEGFAVVEKPIGLRNFIGKDGKILSDEWFNNAHSFNNGFARIRNRDKQYNLITANGKLLFDEWFNYLGDFHDGFAVVRRANGEWAKIDKTGNLIKKMQ